MIDTTTTIKGTDGELVDFTSSDDGLFVTVTVHDAISVANPAGEVIHSAKVSLDEFSRALDVIKQKGKPKLDS